MGEKNVWYRWKGGLVDRRKRARAASRCSIWCGRSERVSDSCGLKGRESNLREREGGGRSGWGIGEDLSREGKSEVATRSG